MSEPKEPSATADVYAGDTSMLDCSAESHDVVYSFAILADPEPNAFARVANSFNLANVAPLSVTLVRTGTGNLQITVDLSDIRATTADSIRRKLEQLTCVTRVELRSTDPRSDFANATGEVRATEK